MSVDDRMLAASCWFFYCLIGNFWLNHLVCRTEADLLRIQKADDVYMQAVDSGDFNAMSETNKALHMAIAHAAINPYFVGYYERLLGEGQWLLHLHFDFTVSSPTATKLDRECRHD
ncbi:FCD domain-containing protein [Paraburkholderia terrae]